MRLLLLQPALYNRPQDRSSGLIPPLGLAYLAAYTPPHWRVTIHDEQLQGARLPDADLVGITVTTWTANRAYELADHYRGLGTPVVLGGVHPSMMPDEALQHADAVVIGDAETVWEQVVLDAEQGTLQPRYQASPQPLTDLRHPRRDLLDGRYMFTAVNTIRGCPFRCEFCAIDHFYEGKVRRRPLDEVMAELETLPDRTVYFVDGNLYGNSRADRRRFIELCNAVEEGQKQGRLRFRTWVAYAPVDALDDDDALAAARAAGCRVLRIGFESIDSRTLEEMRKSQNVEMGPERYAELIRNARRHGLMLTGEFLIGADSDTRETLERTREFILGSGLDLMRLNVLQPLPGTDLLARWKADGRLLVHDFPRDWDRYQDDAFISVVYRPANLTAEELQEFAIECGREFYSYRRIARRGLRSALTTGDAAGAGMMAMVATKSRGVYYDFRQGSRARGMASRVRRRLLRALRA